jgi:hypothetical protein
MDKEIKAMIGLATYTACADADLEQEELATIGGIGLALLDDEKTDSDATLDEILQTMAEFVEAFDKEADDRPEYVINLLRTEAGKITSTDGRILATNFCMHVAEADSDIEDQEVIYIRIAHETWADMNDGWELSWDELVERVIAIRQA